jgi:hypothetical protein
MTGTPPRRLGRSALALFLGFLAVLVLSIGTDFILHALRVFPPPDAPMPDPGLNALALTYRCVYAVFGSWIAARLAPDHPMRHALILGAIGLVLSTAGAVTMMPLNLGPAWYPIALVISTLPCAWLGGLLYRAPQAAH